MLSYRTQNACCCDSSSANILWHLISDLTPNQNEEKKNSNFTENFSKLLRYRLNGSNVPPFFLFVKKGSNTGNISQGSVTNDHVHLFSDHTSELECRLGRQLKLSFKSTGTPSMARLVPLVTVSIASLSAALTPRHQKML